MTYEQLLEKDIEENIGMWLDYNFGPKSINDIKLLMAKWIINSQNNPDILLAAQNIFKNHKDKEYREIFHHPV